MIPHPLIPLTNNVQAKLPGQRVFSLNNSILFFCLWIVYALPVFSQHLPFQFKDIAQGKSGLVAADQQGRIIILDPIHYYPVTINQWEEGNSAPPRSLFADIRSDRILIQDKDGKLHLGNVQGQALSFEPKGRIRDKINFAVFGPSLIYAVSSNGIYAIDQGNSTFRLPDSMLGVLGADWVGSLSSAVMIDRQGRVYRIGKDNVPVLWFTLSKPPLSVSFFGNTLYAINQDQELIEVNISQRTVHRRWQLEAGFHIISQNGQDPLFIRGQQIFILDANQDLVGQTDLTQWSMDKSHTQYRIVRTEMDLIFLNPGENLTLVDLVSKEAFTLGENPPLISQMLIFTHQRSPIGLSKGLMTLALDEKVQKVPINSEIVLTSSSAQGEYILVGHQGDFRFFSFEGAQIEAGSLSSKTTAMYLGPYWLTGQSDGVFSWTATRFKDRNSEFSTLKLGEHRLTALAYFEENNLAAVGNAIGQISILDLNLGMEYQRTRPHRSPVSALAFSPDGAWVASVSDQGEIQIIQTISGQPQAALYLENSELISLQWLSSDVLLTVSPQEAIWWEWRLQRKILVKPLSEGKYWGSGLSDQYIFLYRGDLWEKYALDRPTVILETGNF
jgi:WD40 repeat protein